MIKNENYHLYIYKQIRIEINQSLHFINSFCKERNIKSLKEYFFFKSQLNQIYPDSLDHIMQMKISPFYLVLNKTFVSYYHHLSYDIRNELDMYLKLDEKRKAIMENKHLFKYLQKMLNKYFSF